MGSGFMQKLDFQEGVSGRGVSGAEPRLRALTVWGAGELAEGWGQGWAGSITQGLGAAKAGGFTQGTQPDLNVACLRGGCSQGWDVT